MEEKYDPDRIIKKTWRRFSVLDEYRGSEVHDFQVYIEVQQRGDDKYVIGGYKDNCFLLKYSMKRSSSTITSPQNLFKDRDLLGSVSIKFKRKEMRNYPSYDEFWEDIQVE